MELVQITAEGMFMIEIVQVVKNYCVRKQG